MQAEQKGAVGINIYSFWSYPFKNSSVDLEATQRAKDFMFGWYGIYVNLALETCQMHNPAC